MNSDEISSENVLVTNDDLDGFPSVSLNSEENLEEEKNSDSIATSSSKEHVNATSSLNIGLNSGDQDYYDVIVVGAGLSGLSSAYFMKKKYPNLKFLIIEAKDRVNFLFSVKYLDYSKEKNALSIFLNMIIFKRLAEEHRPSK